MCYDSLSSASTTTGRGGIATTGGRRSRGSSGTACITAAADRCGWFCCATATHTGFGGA